MSFLDLAQKASGISGVEIQSELLPTINVKLGGVGGGSAEPSAVLRFLKPRVIVDSNLGTLDEAPAGNPEPGRFFIPILIGGIVILGLASYGAAKVLQRFV